MIAEIVSVGTELLMGQVVNTDAQYLAQRLAEAGVTLRRQCTVGDNPGRLGEAIAAALARADVVLTTGGLGPTADDITKELAARALNLPMERDPGAERRLRDWFARTGRDMTENNLRQADFPKGARLLENPFGTAPGCIVEKDGKAIILLPGPPRELVPMVETGVMPYLMARGGAVIVSRYLRVFGMGESAVEALTGDLMRRSENPTLAPYCTLGEVQLRLTVRCGTRAEAGPLLDPLEAEVRKRLGPVIYAATESPFYTMEQAVAEAFAGRGLTLAVAESCTGGLIASRLVSVPGASRVFLEGCVSYSNQAKARALGVPRETLERHGAVSQETALAMAAGMRAASGADIALSVTGVAGPDGGTAEKPVGLVFLGLADACGAQAKELRLSGDRERVRTMAALSALHWALEAARASRG